MVDASSNGKIKNIKALQSILEDPLKMRFLAKELFKLIDIDGNQFIEVNELHCYMCDVAKTLKCSPPLLEDVKEIVGNFDNDYDSKISIEEFEIFVREILDKMIDNEMAHFGSKTRHLFNK